LRGVPMLRIKSRQKFFTEEEVANITGICLEHLRGLVQNKHLGRLTRAAEAAGAQAQRLFTHTDLMILTVIHPPCGH
jgi:hypothetical protein